VPRKPQVFSLDRVVGPGVVSFSRENRELIQGGGVKTPLKHKGTF
jgi:hypothetical protein